ncbi:MAG: hypothetical protein NZ700_01505 [Gemmataceae bacterium]|nr:hypothetical protein [Gemmataceae bacterium]MDW8267179.1 hypothetical protein [Gemmataceae bacterium]
MPAPSPKFLRVSPFRNVLETAPNDTPEALSGQPAADLPVAFNGIIERPGDVDCFRFRAAKGQRLRFHALAKTIGSPLDPTIWVRAVSGKGGIQRATDCRLSQLGLPRGNGVSRETLDAILERLAPAEGEYVLGVEDDRQRGGTESV